MGKVSGITVAAGVVVSAMVLLMLLVQQQQYAYSQQQMSATEMVSARQEIYAAARVMDKVADFAKQCSFLVQIGDTSKMSECAEAMGDLGPVFEAWIEAHPIVEELT